MTKSLIPILIVAGCLALVACGGDSGEDGPGGGGAPSFISIGTGSTTGVYYPVGGAVAKLVNRGSDQHAIKASHESTGGSVYNIQAVLAGDLEFGLAQSDRQFQAVQGMAEWEGQPAADLRAVCSFHPEVVTLVADAAIENLQDLAGKRVSLGSPGSGMRQNAIEILQTVGIDPETDIQVEGLKPEEAPSMLQDGRIDAFFFTAGHPNAAITQTTTTGTEPVRLVPIVGVEPLLERYPFYASTVIPAGTYPAAANGDEDVPSIGMLTTLVTSSAVDEETVYQVTKAIFDHLDALKASHAALRGLDPAGMLAGLSAPLHPGARRYFDEAGIAVE